MLRARSTSPLTSNALLCRRDDAKGMHCIEALAPQDVLPGCTESTPAAAGMNEEGLVHAYGGVARKLPSRVRVSWATLIPWSKRF